MFGKQEKWIARPLQLILYYNYCDTSVHQLFNAIVKVETILRVVSAWIAWEILAKSEKSGAPYWYDSLAVI